MLARALKAADPQNDDARRRVLWAIPTVLAALGTVNDDGSPHLMNVSWVAPAGNNPTRLVLSIEQSSRTAANLRARPNGALSLVREDQRELGRAFVKPELPFGDRDGSVTVAGHAVFLSGAGAPVLADAVAAVAGPMTAVSDVGDHALWLMEVAELAADPSLLEGSASQHAVALLNVQHTRMNYGR